MSLLAGMVAGADSIDNVDRLRQAGSQVVFDQIRAPSTLGTFLRAFTHGSALGFRNLTNHIARSLLETEVSDHNYTLDREEPVSARLQVAEIDSPGDHGGTAERSIRSFVKARSGSSKKKPGTRSRSWPRAPS
jgi:hypothetical protein